MDPRSQQPTLRWARCERLTPSAETSRHGDRRRRNNIFFLSQLTGFSAEEPESGDEGAFLTDHTVKVCSEGRKGRSLLDIERAVKNDMHGRSRWTERPLEARFRNQAIVTSNTEKWKASTMFENLTQQAVEDAVRILMVVVIPEKTRENQNMEFEIIILIALFRPTVFRDKYPVLSAQPRNGSNVSPLPHSVHHTARRVLQTTRSDLSVPFQVENRRTAFDRPRKRLVDQKL